ncbi:TetR/AcrR family transcriptional regulator [Nannocystaceae bacterium ST9]
MAPRPPKRAARSETQTPVEPARPRRRRSPEEAREAILAAADRLLAAEGPESVGLAAVAREVGVTHGLVTHYFGTFAGLVREVFVHRNRVAAAKLLEQIVAAREQQDASALARFAIDFVTDEVRARLFLWLRFNDPGGGSGQGATLLRVLIDALERELPNLVGDRPPPSRELIEDVVLLTLAAGHGYAIGKRPWLRGLGRADDPEADEAFRRVLMRAVARLVSPSEG